MGGRYRGFTIIEAMLALIIVAALSVLGVAIFTSVMDRIHYDRAVTDIYLIESLITHFDVNAGHLPASLAQTDAAAMLDPWGRPYQYTDLEDAPKNQAGKPLVPHRMDKFLNPLNSDYDLYSLGKDGRSRMPLTASVSRDDVVRASNGAYVGLGENY